MLLRETNDHFLLIQQHDHAQVSGVMAEHWNPAYFTGQEWRDKVILAIYHHDRGWINLDENPFWDDKAKKPYSFVELPQNPKLAHYKLGIEEVEVMDPYAGLLCSLHYYSFIDPAISTGSQRFIDFEKARQQRLKKELQIFSPVQEEVLNYYLQLLKFCDNLSLYVCLIQPGATNTDNISWFKNGIPSSSFFSFTNGKNIQATWLSENQIQVTPFPFIQELTITIPYKKLIKSDISQQGLLSAFRTAPIQYQEIHLIS
ncbi:DUF3891 family protein [Adhaeribacter aquaticus]|uniref:DUF3891 family protein n=1 Tax=Adhaeribacter aquaticus TaxID=299567 RepID=UPI00047E8F2A|nr:DUF3891 family protein [Adhaeribacter aquaticus]